MYSKLLILGFILCANSLFAQSETTRSDKKNLKSQVLDTQRMISPLATTKDIRSQIKNRQELLTWIFSTSPIAGNTTNSSAMPSRSVSTTTTSANVKLASDQPVEERKIEVAKDVPRVSNQGQ